MLCNICEAVNRDANKFCGMCGAMMTTGVPKTWPPEVTPLKCLACGKVNEPEYQYCAMCGNRMERPSVAPPADDFENPQSDATASVSLPAAEREAGSNLDPLPVAESVESVPQQQRPPRKSAEPLTDVQQRRSDARSLSIFGLDDEPGTDVQYLLQAEGSSPHLRRKFVLLAVLAGLSAVAFFRWRPIYQANPEIVKQAPAEVLDFFARWNHPQNKSTQSPNGIKERSTESAASNGINNHERESSESKDYELNNADALPAAHSAPRQTVIGAVAPKTTRPAHPRKEHAVATKTSALHSRQTDSSDASRSFRRRPSFAMVRAQQFLQGNGVPRNCEQALVYLRAAARRNDPAAAVQMGELYSSGRCVHQDRVMAYRWLNSAREQEPHNAWIQKDLNQLWARMTPLERKQIVN